MERLPDGANVEGVDPQTTMGDKKPPSRHEGQKGARA
ncbi:multidrug efflux system subunit MdtA [Salmonella enterica subsp. enterica serovar Heidelberg str. CFSAN002072]|nr:multidrug efflux system subunit MdtA [Salmonella enterica subsp. enterica serovar Heidelberg str. CFSAN002072]